MRLHVPFSCRRCTTPRGIYKDCKATPYDICDSIPCRSLTEVMTSPSSPMGCRLPCPGCVCKLHMSANHYDHTFRPDRHLLAACQNAVSSEIELLATRHCTDKRQGRCIDRLIIIILWHFIVHALGSSSHGLHFALSPPLLLFCQLLILLLQYMSHQDESQGWRLFPLLRALIASVANEHDQKRAMAKSSNQRQLCLLMTHTHLGCADEPGAGCAGAVPDGRNDARCIHSRLSGAVPHCKHKQADSACTCVRATHRVKLPCAEGGGSVQVCASTCHCRSSLSDSPECLLVM